MALNKVKVWLKAIEKYNTHRMELNLRKSALLVIDMQNDFLDPCSSVYTKQAKEIVPNIKKLLALYRRKKLPIIFTAHQHKDPKIDGGMTASFWPEISKKKVLIAETSGTKIYSELKPKKGEILITKQRYSAFYNTSLELILRGMKVEDLVISGIMTNICCESTARDAFFRDFRVFFVADATASINEELHLASLKNLAYAFAYVLSVEEVISQEHAI